MCPPPANSWRGGTALRAPLLHRAGTFTGPEAQPVLAHLLTDFGPAVAELSSPQPREDAGLDLPLHLVRTEVEIISLSQHKKGQDGYLRDFSIK